MTSKDKRIAELAAKFTEAGRTDRIWTKGTFQDLPILRAPTELLYLNDDNRRFRAEAQGAAAELGRPLDPTVNPDDEQSIISLLLDRDPHVEGTKVVGRASKEAIALLADWEKRGQEKAFWIRPDGLVLNGNRRLAMIKREQQQRGATFSDWVEVVVFSEDEYDREVVFDLEAAEQLTEGLKVRYSDINVLLTLRDAAIRKGVEWADPESVKAVAGRIQHLVNNDPAYAEVQLNAIRYMDLYLEDIERVGEYHRLQRMVERFREVGITMAAVAADDASVEDKMLNVMFAAVQANNTNLDIRALRRLWRNDPDEFLQLNRYVQELEAESEPEDEDEDVSDLDVVIDADEEGDEADAPGPTAPNYPKHSVKRALDNAVELVNDSRRRDKRAHVLSAASRLGAITAADLEGHLGDGAEAKVLRDAIAAIVEWGDEMRPLVAERQAAAQ